MSFGRSGTDNFILVLGSPQVVSSISRRDYAKSGRIHLFSKLIFVCIFWILAANGGGEFYFAYRVSCSGVMKLKPSSSVNFSLFSSILGSAYLFLSGAVVLL